MENFLCCLRKLKFPCVCTGSPDFALLFKLLAVQSPATSNYFLLFCFAQNSPRSGIRQQRRMHKRRLFPAQRRRMSSFLKSVKVAFNAAYLSAYKTQNFKICFDTYCAEILTVNKVFIRQVHLVHSTAICQIKIEQSEHPIPTVLSIQSAIFIEGVVDLSVSISIHIFLRGNVHLQVVCRFVKTDLFYFTYVMQFI